MSRSHRHTPIIGHTCARSEKEDKRIASGRLRSLYRSLMSHKNDEFVPPDWKVIGHGSWHFSKDGKQYLDLAALRRTLSVREVKKLLGK